MKGEQISDALNMLPDEMLEETDKVRNRKKRSRIWQKWLIIAACMVLAVFACTWIYSQKLMEHEENKLPILTVDREWRGGDMGMFESVRAYDISEWTNNNPWTEKTEISSLPVYQTPLDLEACEKGSAKYGGDDDKMEAALRDAADRLGLDGSSLEVDKKEWLSNAVFDMYFTAEEDGMSINVGQDLTVGIEFDPAVIIPEEYDFDYDSSYEDLEKVSQYLKEKYKDLLGMKQPRISIYGGDYNDDGGQSYDVEFYDGDGDITQQIIDYNFNRIAFASEKNKLWSVCISQPDLSKEVGTYPIITLEEAKECLLNGDYISSSPYEIPRREYVVRTELVYRNEVWEEYYMPYYEFYVELPKEEENGMKTYGCYYVPAVEKQYLSYQGEARYN